MLPLEAVAFTARGWRRDLVPHHWLLGQTQVCARCSWGAQWMV